MTFFRFCDLKFILNAKLHLWSLLLPNVTDTVYCLKKKKNPSAQEYYVKFTVNKALMYGENMN